MYGDSISGEKEEESSSDWSSSDEDEDGDDANFNPLRPSTHSALQAQWEWRAMGESLSEKWVNNKLYGCIYKLTSDSLCLLLLLLARNSVSPMGTGHTPRKKPPPVAPKPRVSLSHHSTHTAELDYQLLEDPSSFLEVYIATCIEHLYYTLTHQGKKGTCRVSILQGHNIA